MCIHGPSRGPDDHDEAACAFYENPAANLESVGPPWRKRALTEVDDTDMTPAEFRAAMRRGRAVQIATSRKEYLAQVATFIDATPEYIRERKDRALASVGLSEAELADRVARGVASWDEIDAWSEVDAMNFLARE